MFVENITNGEQRKLDVEADRIALFNTGKWQLAAVKNASETEDVVTFWTIGDELTQVWQKTISKVYAMTTCAKIKFKQALGGEGNSYYTGQARQENPDFFDIDAEEAVDCDEFLLVQTLDKEVIKLPLDGQPPITQHELPVLCPTLVSAFISGQEASIAFHPPTMKLFINSRLF